MAFTIYDAAIPPMIHMLGSLSSVLAKGAAHAKETGASEASYIDARVHPDMLPLKAQVYIATDTAKGAGARLGGVEIPKFEDTEVTFADLRERCARTIAFLKTLDKAGFAGAEDKDITLKFPSRELNFTGAGYVTGFVLPNFYFHITTAYAILRAKGVALGKSDYLGG